MRAKKRKTKQPRERGRCSDKEKDKVRRTIRREKDEVTRRRLGDRGNIEAK
jgi:hypothetical protein